jgi:hypothetical protein
MEKKDKTNFNGLMIVFGIIIFISVFYALVQLTSFIYLLREIPELIDLILLK